MIRIHGAGRTDAKVHALGQVASFRCPSDIPATALQRALNSLLPRDIVVHEVQDVPADFHARFSALGKVYAYRILNRLGACAIAVALCVASPAGIGCASDGAGWQHAYRGPTTSDRSRRQEVTSRLPNAH